MFKMNNTMEYYLNNLEDNDIKLPDNENEWYIIYYNEKDRTSVLCGIEIWEDENEMLIEDFNIGLRYADINKKEIETFTLDGTDYPDTFDIWFDKRVIWI